VNVEVAQLRMLTLAPRTFLKLALGSAAALYLIVITGSLVRLTGSGLGCESWPGCEEGNFFPASDAHGAIEFGNRALGVVPIGLSLLSWLGARRTGGLPGWAVRLAGAVALGTLAQAPLGLVTITSGLHPLLVMSHFLLALAVLGGAVVLVIEAVGLAAGRADLGLPKELRRLGLVIAATCLLLVVSGAFATAAGPHPGDSSDVERLGTLEDMLWVHVRVTAVFGCALLLVLGYLAARRERWPRLFRAGLAVLALVLVQMAIGELQYRLELPWGIVAVHVALAAAVWAATVALVTAFWRTPAVVAASDASIRRRSPALPGGRLTDKEDPRRSERDAGSVHR
jgi:cytochrome c oxidase assembly protein subunit 15